MPPETAPTDSELVQRAKAGDKTAFDLLVTRNEGRVYGLCLKMLGNPEDAEDVLQEVFVKAFQSLPNFQGGVGVLDLGLPHRDERLSHANPEEEAGDRVAGPAGG